MPTCAHTCVPVQAHTCEHAVPRVCSHSHMHIHVLTAPHACSSMCTHAVVHMHVCKQSHTVTYMHKGEWTDGASPQAAVRKTAQVSQLTSVGYRNCLFILPATGLVITPTERGIGPCAEPSTGPCWPVRSSIWHSPASTFQQHSLNVKMHVWGPVLDFVS